MCVSRFIISNSKTSLQVTSNELDFLFASEVVINSFALHRN